MADARRWHPGSVVGDRRDAQAGETERLYTRLIALGFPWLTLVGFALILLTCVGAPRASDVLQLNTLHACFPSRQNEQGGGIWVMCLGVFIGAYRGDGVSEGAQVR